MSKAERFNVAAYASELEGPPNHDIGSSILFENSRVRIWELKLAPGERLPFHWHIHPNMWVVIDGGVMRGMRPDGTFQDRVFKPGLTYYFEPSEEHPEIHSVENVGESTIRIRNIELIAIDIGGSSDRSGPVIVGIDAG